MSRTVDRLRRRAGVVLAMSALLVAVVPGPVALADDAGTGGREYTGVYSPTTGLYVVVDDRTSSPTVIDLDHPALTVTGRVRLYAPATDTYVEHSGGTVELWVAVGFSRAPTVTAPVAEDGTFTVAVPVRARAGEPMPTAHLWWTPDSQTQQTLNGNSPIEKKLLEWPVAVAGSSFRFLPDQTGLTVKYGSSVGLSGVLERLAGDAWVPAPDVDLTIPSNLVPGPLFRAVRTDGAGRASFTVSPARDGVVEVALADPAAVFLASTDPTVVGSVPVDVIPRSTLRWTQHGVDHLSYITMNGTLTADPTSVPLQPVTVWLQESTDGRTGWRDIARTSAEIGETNVGSWPTFLGRTYIAHPSHYFRLVFRGTASVQGSTSQVIRPMRRETRVVKFRITSTKGLPYNQMVLSGVVQRHTDSGWVNLGRRTKVFVAVRPTRGRHKGDTLIYTPALATRASGAFVLRFSAYEEGYWFIYFQSYYGDLVDSRSAKIFVSAS